MKIFEDQLIVVTGGAGFIGSGIVRFLNDRGLDNIIIVDELGTTEKWKNLVGKRFVDIVPKGQLFNWLHGRESIIEAFIHLGACSNTLETNASFLLENNFHYTVHLAEYALTHGHRFIYASSAATYGDGHQGFVDDESHLYDLKPMNMYGFSKQLFDQWASNQGVLDKLVGLKYFNVFGPNEKHKARMASVIVKIVPQILNGESVKLFKSSDPKQFGDGEQKRDFIYVKDVARMTCAFLDNDVGGIYNIGSGIPATWNELANAVFYALGLEPKIEYIDMPADLVKKYQNYSKADMTKTNGVLGESMTKCTSLKEAVKDYVQNYIIPEQQW
ncbi:MAG: ADP-glyceromanno-heptose 6-epimerase [Parachlamydiaceae bacterium]|nr:ADP-glyceromanno-heptose 6-epimerase [Parachlamydiaceae bacterium]